MKPKVFHDSILCCSTFENSSLKEGAASEPFLIIFLTLTARILKSETKDLFQISRPKKRLKSGTNVLICDLKPFGRMGNENHLLFSR